MTGMAVLTILILMITYTTEKSRIAGGKKVKVGQFPFFAQILVMHREAYVCGGSLVHTQWILTVAHCFPRNRRDTQQMALSNHILTYMGTTQQYVYVHSDMGFKSYAQGVYQHPRFQISYKNQKKGITDRLVNDIALVHVREPFPINRYIKIIKLPNEKVNPNVCENGVIVGGGKTTYRDESGKDVLYTKVDLKELNNLGVQLPPWSVRSTVFYSVKKWYKGHAMPGDSGGPYVCYMSEYRIPVLYGIISSNRKQNDTIVTEYETVLKFMDFIKKSVPYIEIYRKRSNLELERSKRSRKKKGKDVSAGSAVLISFRHFVVFILFNIIKIF